MPYGATYFRALHRGVQYPDIPVLQIAFLGVAKGIKSFWQLTDNCGETNVPISKFQWNQYPNIPFSVGNIQYPDFKLAISPAFWQYPISSFEGCRALIFLWRSCLKSNGGKVMRIMPPKTLKDSQRSWKFSPSVVQLCIFHLSHLFISFQMVQK